MSKFYTKKEISAEWTGSYPNLCSGYWVIKIDGIQLMEKDTKPYGESILSRNMNTEGTYKRWYFDNDGSVEWKSYLDGMNFEDWSKSEISNEIKQLLNYNKIEWNKDLLKDLFTKLQKEDWRHSSCGGCI